MSMYLDATDDQSLLDLDGFQYLVGVQPFWRVELLAKKHANVTRHPLTVEEKVILNEQGFGKFGEHI